MNVSIIVNYSGTKSSYSSSEIYEVNDTHIMPFFHTVFATRHFELGRYCGDFGSSTDKERKTHGQYVYWPESFLLMST